jgi:hypothetical protein
VLRKELKEGYRDERLIEKQAGEGGAAS